LIKTPFGSVLLLLLLLFLPLLDKKSRALKASYLCSIAMIFCCYLHQLPLLHRLNAAKQSMRR
jgi:hypothetical protein